MSQNDNSCEWSGCTRPRTKHVHFGMNTLKLKPGVDIFASRYTMHHLDLCSEHALDVADHYIYFTEHELGECSDRQLSRP